MLRISVPHIAGALVLGIQKTLILEVETVIALRIGLLMEVGAVAERLANDLAVAE